MKNRFWLLIAFASLGLASCTKDIDIDLNSASPQLVIEGEINNQAEPYTVKISKTVNFSEPNTYPAATSATVKISDNSGTTETLIETSPGIYTTKTLKGEVGKTYTLTVLYEGKTYTASSTMPQAVPLKSIKAEPRAFSPAGQESYLVTPIYDDPMSSGNSYRFIQYVGQKKDPEFIVFNDNVNNGSTNSRPVAGRGFRIKKGDTYTLEMQCIDKMTYDYFFTLSQIAGNGPGGGATPSNPTNNISGGALGYFSAHTVEKKTILIE